MSLNPLRALGSASCHRIFKDFDEMERQQSHEMRVVAWLCEISLTPAWPQYAGIPHPTRPLASSPARGAGAVVVIPGEGCIRENKPTRQLVLQALPIPWTVGGIASGGGADGEGAKSPLPCHSWVQYASISCSGQSGEKLQEGAKRGKHP